MSKSSDHEVQSDPESTDIFSPDSMREGDQNVPAFGSIRAYVKDNPINPAGLKQLAIASKSAAKNQLALDDEEKEVAGSMAEAARLVLQGEDDDPSVPIKEPDLPDALHPRGPPGLPSDTPSFKPGGTGSSGGSCEDENGDFDFTLDFAGARITDPCDAVQFVLNLMVSRGVIRAATYKNGVFKVHVQQEAHYQHLVEDWLEKTEARDKQGFSLDPTGTNLGDKASSPDLQTRVVAPVANKSAPAAGAGGSGLTQGVSKPKTSGTLQLIPKSSPGHRENQPSALSAPKPTMLQEADNTTGQQKPQKKKKIYEHTTFKYLSTLNILKKFKTSEICPHCPPSTRKNRRRWLLHAREDHGDPIYSNLKLTGLPD